MSREQSNSQWSQRYAASMLGVFAPLATLVEGRGCWVWDADGRRYLDLFSGIAVNALGHAHPAWVEAVANQLATLGHVSNFFASPPQVELAEKLLALANADTHGRVFLSNSGTEAMEAAVKMALRTGRPRLLAAEGSFHGRTLGALALTSKEVYRKPFEPLPGEVEFLPFGNVDALVSAVDAGVGAIVLEVVQGEGGVKPLPPGYLERARELADGVGALLIVDEVQTGIGRTGTWFAHRNPALVQGPVVPDVVTLAKGLGAGFPIGATLALSERAAGLLGAGDHGTTFGGNPPAAAAALATLRIIESEGLIARSAAVMDRLMADVGALDHPLVAGTRGAGSLRAIVLARPVAPRVATAALKAGFIVNAVAPDAIRLAPPLILTPDQAAGFVEALPALFDSATSA
ncbi:MAG: acetylornithine transaminase [Bifidobacteriaceae bacterium]|jgi:acetylornithine aminotransferase|nr:acetylornithine transaminase [Bifidobacteriaceae bacterium]